MTLSDLITRLVKHPGPDGAETHGTGTDQSVHAGGAGVSLSRIDDYYTADNVIETTYRGSHQPSPDYGAPAHDLTQIVAEDIYTHPEYYMSPDQVGYRPSVDMIRAVRGKPGAEVTVYRAIPRETFDAGQRINPGDWVTPSRAYAKLHGTSNVGDYVLVKRTVKARELVWPADYLPEWGWFPDNSLAKHGGSSHDQKSHGNWAKSWAHRIIARHLEGATGYTRESLQRWAEMDPDELVEQAKSFYRSSFAHSSSIRAISQGLDPAPAYSDARFRATADILIEATRRSDDIKSGWRLQSWTGEAPLPEVGSVLGERLWSFATQRSGAEEFRFSRIGGEPVLMEMKDVPALMFQDGLEGITLTSLRVEEVDEKNRIIRVRPDITKHWGPGPHPGTGTPQAIHAPGGGFNRGAIDSHIKTRHAKFLERFPGAPDSFVATNDGGNPKINSDTYGWINDVFDQLKADEALKDEWWDEADELIGSLREIEDEVERDLFIRLAKGELSAEEAIERGLPEWSQELRDLGPLPRDLYHVTTDTESVLATGLKARDELAQAKGAGLGGGTANTISFTDDPDVAQNILERMRERHRVLNDPANEIPQLIKEAKEGVGADQPWWGEPDQKASLAIKWEGEHMDHLSGGGIDNLIEGRHIYMSSLGHSTVEEVRQHLNPERFDLDSPDTIKLLGTDGTSFNRHVFEVKYNEQGHAEAIGDFMDEYVLRRSFAGGPEDPLFIMNDDLAFKNKDASDFSIIHGKAKEGAMGYQLSSLGEWRTWTGEVLEDVEVLR